jgi:ubiquinone/menaquinone biosynthesis C-methylase UbiE
MADLVVPHLSPGDKVLDVGCGDLRIGEEVRRKINVTWVGVDTINYHQSDLEFQLFDGKKLPFNTHAFDVVLVAFVFHHCDDCKPLLGECLRVNKRRVILFEDVLSGTRFNRFITRFHDRLVNWIVDQRIYCPCTFKTQDEWFEVFRVQGFKNTFIQPLKTHALAFVDQKLFVFDC